MAHHENLVYQGALRDFKDARRRAAIQAAKLGRSVLVVDDLLATGGTAIAGANLLRRAGARVEHAMFVIDLPELAGAQALRDAGVTPNALMEFAGH